MQRALERRRGVIVLSHPRPSEEGKPDPQLSLAPVAQRLRELLARPVRVRVRVAGGRGPRGGELVLCENVRFNKGEKKDDERLARKLAALCDVFVMDAFGTAHRAEASTHGVVRFAPVACADRCSQPSSTALGARCTSPRGRSSPSSAARKSPRSSRC
jgi:phosphoglycerate kinase